MSDRTFAPTAAGSTSGILLSRLGGTRPFSTGSASPIQRDLVDEAAQSESNMIYYASLSIPAQPLMPGGDGNDLGDFTESGDNGVVTGGGGDGSASGGDVGLPTAIPAPDAATLGLLGVLMLTHVRRHRPCRTA